MKLNWNYNVFKTDDSTHRHTCRANQNFTKVFMFRFVLFFNWKSYFLFWAKVSVVEPVKFISGLCVLRVILSNTHRTRIFLIRFQIFPNKVVHIFAVIPATSTHRFLQNDHSVHCTAGLELTSAAPWSNNMLVTSHLLTFKGNMPIL